MNKLEFKLFVLRVKTKRSLARLRIWLDQNLPAPCPACGKWFLRKKSLRWARHHIAGSVLICQQCWDDLYQPVSKSTK